MIESSSTPLLDTIDIPADLRGLRLEDLPQLATELRSDLITSVSKTGGHLGAGRGVVELTIAIHYVFNTPDDRLIWDVGHQAYPHKLLTGRRERFATLRQEGGISGFTKRAESEYDPFGAAHSSTSISAGLGMAVARDLKHEARNVVAVIGDGAMSAGMAFESLNNAGALGSRLIVILNDNDMSIAPPSGVLSAYLARLATGKTYADIKGFAKRLTAYFGTRADRSIKRAVGHARGRIVKEGSKIALLSFGTRHADCLIAAQELDAAGLTTTVADARFAKPLDEAPPRQKSRNFSNRRRRCSRGLWSTSAAFHGERRPAGHWPENQVTYIAR